MCGRQLYNLSTDSSMNTSLNIQFTQISNLGPLKSDLGVYLAFRPIFFIYIKFSNLIFLTLSRVGPSAVSKGWGLIGPPQDSKGVGVVLVSKFSCNLRYDHD